jgi:hypothetical protein
MQARDTPHAAIVAFAGSRTAAFLCFTCYRYLPAKQESADSVLLDIQISTT